MLYALMKSGGVRPERWQRGVKVGAVKDTDRLHLSLVMPATRRIQFDFARHRRVMNFDRNYVRLNEFPEWFVVDENTLYSLKLQGTRARGELRLGSELIRGVELSPGNWTIEPAGRAPYATPAPWNLGRFRCGAGGYSPAPLYNPPHP
jgi:hypothetical protein